VNRLLLLIVILSLLVTVGMAVAAQVSASVRRAFDNRTERPRIGRRPPSRPPLDVARPTTLGRGLWRDVFADCAADVLRFERVTSTVQEPAVRRWLDELVPELRDRLQRVRRLAELGQTLSPDPHHERDITNETARRIWHACVRAWAQFSRMADKSGAVAYDLIGTPEVASVERQLRAIEEVVRDLRRAIDDAGDSDGGDRGDPTSR
jgi:hypothetical protein